MDEDVKKQLIPIYVHVGPVTEDEIGNRVLTRVIPKVGERIVFEYWGDALPKTAVVSEVVYTFAKLDGDGYCINIAIGVKPD